MRVPALRGVDQANGHAKFPMKFASEVVRDPREGLDRMRCTNLPRTIHIWLWTLECPHRDGEKADLRIIRCDHLRGGVEALANRPFHVRLTGSEPDLADEDIVERDARRVKRGRNKCARFGRGW